ncbi:PIGA (GPI anchor biosynthesis) [Rhizoctonia solani]|uniref:PIGA (GPI anchor biosynthesis) n=1 Tax=Rhizoctonia solani TaxID=456999 RepID=A0A8H7MA30_9AGAM|nr:PIGA (GPI anchor biosynthesis) [Rhizoctonia solani]
MLRANAVVEVLQNPADPRFFVVPNAILPEQFQPGPVTQRDLKKQITIVVISRLAYRKGVDLLVAAAPRICAQFPQVHFVIGGDGPKLTNLLQMRERHMLQDRIHLLALYAMTKFTRRHLFEYVINRIFRNRSSGSRLHRIICGEHRVGGVPEVLPQDMISFAMPEEDDVTRALGEAIAIVTKGKYNPQKHTSELNQCIAGRTWRSGRMRYTIGLPPRNLSRFGNDYAGHTTWGCSPGRSTVVVARDQLDVLSDEDEWDASRFARITHDEHE